MSENLSVAEILKPQPGLPMKSGKHPNRRGIYRGAQYPQRLQAIGNTLHPQVHVVGPVGEVHGKESFLGNLSEGVR